MKTAISIPDEVFAAAEKTAKRLGVSRSELYSTAVRDYVDLHNADRVTEKLDAIYGDHDSSLDRVLASMQTQSIEEEDW